MIAQLRGKLVFKSSTEAIIDCCGVGYSVLISVNTSDSLPSIGDDVLLYTLLVHREDAMLLFGFKDVSEREAFKMLTSVSGIGGKIALGILSSLTVSALQQFVLGSNLVALQKLPGIGKKTAERLVLELKDKIINIGQQLKSELQLYKNVYSDKRTPMLPKICFAIGIGYLLLPFDLIPDFIPIIGHLDDAVIVHFFIYLAIKWTPSEIIEEHRDLLKKKNS